MKMTQVLIKFMCALGFIWVFAFVPGSYINVKQYIYKDTYVATNFVVEKLKLKCSDGCSGSVEGTVLGKHEEMGIGHFYLKKDMLSEVMPEILPGDAENRFVPGSNFIVYYNPNLSNFTFSSCSARFVPEDRYKQLTALSTIKMLVILYLPLLGSLLAWYLTSRHGASSGSNLVDTED